MEELRTCPMFHMLVFQHARDFEKKKQQNLMLSFFLPSVFALFSWYPNNLHGEVIAKISISVVNCAPTMASLSRARPRSGFFFTACTNSVFFIVIPSVIL